MNHGPATATTWIFRGDESRPRRGHDVDIPRGRLAAAPRLRRGTSVWTSARSRSRYPHINYFPPSDALSSSKALRSWKHARHFFDL